MLTYKIILAVSMFLIWLSMLASRFAKYDENYALMFFAVVISIFACISMAFYSYFRWEIVKSLKILTISFIASSSPISLYLFIYSFEDVFGGFFNYPS
jgi:hypothetical protein